jgi:hypothetical protein
LLKKGANPRNILAEVRYNTDKPVMLAELLRYGAKVNAKDSSRSTPLHHAVFGNNFYDRLEQLLKVGANPNAQNNDNETPFTRTMGKVYLKRPVQTVNMFLDFQADPLLQDNFGHTAFSLALNTCPEVMLLMVQNEHIWPALKAFNPSAKSMEIVNIVDAKIRQHQNSIARMEVEQDPEGVIDRLRKKWAIDELKNKVAVLESPKKRSELVLDVQRKIQQELCPQFSYAWLMQRQTGFTRKQIMHNTALTHFDFESWLSEREESKED